MTSTAFRELDFMREENLHSLPWSECKEHSPLKNAVNPLVNLGHRIKEIRCNTTSGAETQSGSITEKAFPPYSYTPFQRVLPHKDPGNDGP